MGLIYTLAYVTTVLVMGIEQAQIFYWPFVEVLKVIRFAIIERIDNFFLYFWAVKVVLVAAIMYFAGTFSLAVMTNKKYHDIWALVCWPVVYATAIFPSDIVELEEVTAIVTNWAGTFNVLLPISLLLIAKVRKVPDIKSTGRRKKVRK